jgi:hypothetical protein
MEPRHDESRQQPDSPAWKNPRRAEEDESAADILRARQRCRMEAAGLPYVEEHRYAGRLLNVGMLSLVDILSGRYNDKNPPP